MNSPPLDQRRAAAATSSTARGDGRPSMAPHHSSGQRPQHSETALGGHQQLRRIHHPIERDTPDGLPWQPVLDSQPLAGGLSWLPHQEPGRGESEDQLSSQATISSTLNSAAPIE